MTQVEIHDDLLESLRGYCSFMPDVTVKQCVDEAVANWIQMTAVPRAVALDNRLTERQETPCELIAWPVGK
jgi:hypothetical protein